MLRLFWVFTIACYWLRSALAQQVLSRHLNQIVLGGPSQVELKEEFVELPLDHTATNITAVTFPNRFFVRSDWYKQGGPVFLYDGGEAPAPVGEISRDPANAPEESLTLIERLAKIHGGLIIAWEHRYYGQSIPRGVNITQSKETDFKYLTTKQALADVNHFANNFARSPSVQFPADLDLTPRKTPWIFVGGSYPGARAAMLRVRYNQTIWASYASSAPVQAIVNMPMYYEPIWKGMRSNGLTNCSADMHAAILAIDARMDESTAAADKIKEQLFGCSVPTNHIIAQLLASLWSTWQSYGMNPDDNNKLPGILSLCNHISFDPKTKTYSPADGWAKLHPQKVNFTLDRLASWPGFRDQTGREFNCGSTRSECYQYTDPDWISWMWQFCTEYGYFQVGNPGDSQIVSKYYTADLLREQCHCQFKPSGTPRAMPDTPAIDLVNTYGGMAMRPSRTFWTNGEFDPWSTLSPLTVTNETIPACEAPEIPGSPLFGYVLKNNQHCGDLAGSREGSKAGKLFSDAVKQWLCCFTKSHAMNTGADKVLCPNK